MAHRYFTKDIVGDTATITGPDALHLAKVLRAKPGEKLILCNGKQMDYEAEITEVSASVVRLRVLGSYPSVAEPTIWVEAFIGYAKGERMDLAVQKAVELGAGAIRPFFSANTVVKPAKTPADEQKKAQRLNRIAAEAAKQSGRGILPQVALPMPFKQALTLANNYDVSLFLYEGGGQPLQQVVQQQERIAIFTGAEGGFTPTEAEQAVQAGLVPVGLGPRILRCETAPAAALAVVMALTGNLE
ncbi:16S rRNA (uracil(1498)-N(3))-methyltransferase [Ruminococcaceae bacterium OttesenSCG-928-A16]|nr:16S rRNA (uracil(1498)-N(3))-methyltransferase [Ruminococcaceae bacterium OttesenSCG-928-A16]